MDAVPIVPPLFRAPKTRHFTSYKHTADHELLTEAGARTCRFSAFRRRLPSESSASCGEGKVQKVSSLVLNTDSRARSKERLCRGGGRARAGDMDDPWM